ncbi:hypothetical protein DICVIV_13049 [Dictyocaulus viviparus]|uniref:Uncharacterized protein n=1 Tax=Dictyocaulus viviparus TaxID=29172 RepID=A0A0D8X8T1_DICVI|nr:hypothetical protein DICVIV_13049 [Dictyocaulus viviparus]
MSLFVASKRSAVNWRHLSAPNHHKIIARLEDFQSQGLHGLNGLWITFESFLFLEGGGKDVERSMGFRVNCNIWHGQCSAISLDSIMSVYSYVSTAVSSIAASFAAPLAQTVDKPRPRAPLIGRLLLHRLLLLERTQAPIFYCVGAVVLSPFRLYQ